jgi:hypothetical protein
MTCREFDRWLDEGPPPAAGAEAMRAHAGACARCASALRAAEALEQALALPAASSAPATFTSEVMRRVRAARAARAAVTTLSLPPALAWWVRAFADPLVALAFVLTAVLAWFAPSLWVFAGVLSTRIAAFGGLTLRLPGAAALTVDMPSALRVFADPMVVLGLGLAVTPAALWLAWQAYRWSEHAFSLPMPRRAR